MSHGQHGECMLLRESRERQSSTSFVIETDRVDSTRVSTVRILKPQQEVAGEDKLARDIVRGSKVTRVAGEPREQNKGVASSGCAPLQYMPFPARRDQVRCPCVILCSRWMLRNDGSSTVYSPWAAPTHSLHYFRVLVESPPPSQHSQLAALNTAAAATSFISSVLTGGNSELQPISVRLTDSHTRVLDSASALLSFKLSRRGSILLDDKAASFVQIAAVDYSNA
ncbi:uncharacterized protein LAESUDRAFT_725322 [Laetiporus sulphureus 93-53]|uniref:Uncharacterized protein n=1 Tax=Laetiporus sulphureus 93-53 TaxID=1314785 RepID=A0A165EGF3_9APHY|nr:uncharacterized protein LAESUDRAFT_725322 [Laetiporus sulphureus 93-53]KZT07004.1 hypothetical protein LAESUDRAFT_725322 [Laetiporus sulphureus 93-53]